MYNWRNSNWGWQGRPLGIYIVKKGCLDGIWDEENIDTSVCENVLTEEGLEMWMIIDDVTQKLVWDIEVEEDGEIVSKKWRYQDSCNKLKNSHFEDCQSSSVTDYFNRNLTYFYTVTDTWEKKVEHVTSKFMGSSPFMAWQRNNFLYYEKEETGSSTIPKLS